MHKHMFPYIYDQCEDKTGYDEMIKRLTRFELLEIIDVNCVRRSPTLWASVDINNFNEFIDFIDGNGFFINEVDDYYFIMPMKK